MAPKSILTRGHESGKIGAMATTLLRCAICKIGLLYKTRTGMCHRCEDAVSNARAHREEVR